MGSSWDLSRYAVGYRKDYINQLYPICVCVCVLNIGYCRSPSGNFNEEHDNDKPWVHWAKVGCHSGVSKGIVSDSGGMVREENQLVDGQFPQKWSQKKVPVFHSYPFIPYHQHISPIQIRPPTNTSFDLQRLRRLISDISGPGLKPLINHGTGVGTGSIVSIDGFFHIALQQVWPLGRWHV